MSLSCKSSYPLVRPAAIAALALVAGTAGAATLQYSLSGPSFAASWQLPSSPTPSQTDLDSFTLRDVQGSFPGTDGIVDLIFSSGGRFTISDTNGAGTLLAISGSPLFSGTVSMPSLLSGSYSLKAGIPGYDDGAPRYSLSITQAAAVPEPASYALLLAGMTLMLAAARRRRDVGRDEG